MVRLINQKGFTLIELLIAMAIIGVVLGGIVGIFTSTTSYQTKQEMMVSLTQDLRAAKHLMTDEIRSAGTNPENNTRIGFLRGDDSLNTDANSIRFQRDIDNGDGDHFFEPDGDADDPGEEIGYYRVDGADNLMQIIDTAPGRLVRDDGTGPVTVMDNVIGLQFLYYDDDDDPITTFGTNNDLDDIRMVEVVLTAQVDNPNRVTEQNQISRFKIAVRNSGL